MNKKTINNKLIFDCGCSFPILADGNLDIYFDAHNPKFNINPLCKQTWNDLENYTQGVFQLEKPSGRIGCQKLKPRNMEHMAALGAILRPGAAEAKDENGVSIKDHYIKRKNNLEEVEPYQSIMDEVLKDTYGCMIYQENAMRIAVEIAGFNPMEADSLRKAIGKKIPEEMTKSKKLFLEKAKQKGILNDEQIEEVFGWIEKSQRYSFNKCLAGDTIICGPTGGKKTANDYWHKINPKKAREGFRGWGLSLNREDKLIKNKILDVSYAGHFPVYRLILQDGNYCDLTNNHKVPTTNGEKLVSNLQLGDKLYIKQTGSLKVAEVKLVSIEPQPITDTYDISMNSPYHTLAVNNGIIVSNSHAVSYGLLGYICAYIKTHFPLQFYVNWLKNEKDKTSYKGLIDEAKLFASINVYPPDLRDLETDFYVKDKNIKFGLTNIKNVGKKDYTKIVEVNTNNENALNWADSKVCWPEIMFTLLGEINSRGAESLILAGALDYLKLDRQRMLIEFRECKELFKTSKKEYEYIIENLLDRVTVSDILSSLLQGYKVRANRIPKIKAVIDYLNQPIAELRDTIDSILFAEKDLLGVSLTNHASDNLPSAIETHSCLDIHEGYNDHAVLKVKIERVKNYIDKNGNEMAFIGIADNTCELDSVIFHESYGEHKHLINEGALLFVSGHKNNKSFIIEKVYAN